MQKRNPQKNNKNAPTRVRFFFLLGEDKIYITFLFSNKKVTKEVVRGEALRANRILAPAPTPAAIATAH